MSSTGSQSSHRGAEVIQSAVVRSKGSRALGARNEEKQPEFPVPALDQPDRTVFYTIAREACFLLELMM
jgi:hypothetical protein